ncbi:MAG: branched-chain amino acid ABC transporter permease, partial [Candidatus Rokuibacteriota bacterium]
MAWRITLEALVNRPVPATITAMAFIALSGYAVAHFPRSLLAFLLFQASILLLYFCRVTPWLKASLAILALGLLMPIFGTINGYYLEVATQVGIFVALALGLNIVVGLAGLLDLGYVAFFAVGAYTWAIFGSPHANKFISEAVLKFPLASEWFFVFLLVGVITGAVTGILLGLPVLRLRGDYLAIVT